MSYDQREEHVPNELARGLSPETGEVMRSR